MNRNSSEKASLALSNNLKLLATTFLLVTVSLLVSCSSSKKTEDAAPESLAPSEKTAPPSIETSPMSFDASGSDSGKIEGLETINFEYDQSTLSAEARKKLQGNANWMKKNSSAKVVIEGHCDNRGSNEYNIALGERRAKAVKDYMVGLGVAATRLDTVSYGKEKPVSMGDSESSHRKNRRANFVPGN